MESRLKLILARITCLALGLAVLEVLPGCASSGDRGAPGTELNPHVTCKTQVTGFKSGPKAVFRVRVEQTDPMIMRPHTWTARLWTSESNHAEVTPDRAGWIMADSWQSCRPDLKAGCEEIDLKYCAYGARSTARYTVVVVEVIEMTGGDCPKVYATKTHALAFENGRQYEDPVVIPLCTDANLHAPAAALELILDSEKSSY